jgi:hypothetical protein
VIKVLLILYVCNMHVGAGSHCVEVTRAERDVQRTSQSLQEDIRDHCELMHKELESSAKNRVMFTRKNRDHEVTTDYIQFRGLCIVK